MELFSYDAQGQKKLENVACFVKKSWINVFIPRLTPKTKKSLKMSQRKSELPEVAEL